MSAFYIVVPRVAILLGVFKRLMQKIDRMFGRGVIDDALYDELEEALLQSDTHIQTTGEILEELRKAVRVEKITDPAAPNASDGFHIVAPDPNGEQAGHAMTRAIELAGLVPTDIDHINAHATGTSVGDVAEGKAINNALGSHRPSGRPARIGDKRDHNTGGAQGEQIGGIRRTEGKTRIDRDPSRNDEALQHDQAPQDRMENKERPEIAHDEAQIGTPGLE